MFESVLKPDTELSLLSHLIVSVVYARLMFLRWQKKSQFLISSSNIGKKYKYVIPGGGTEVTKAIQHNLQLRLHLETHQLQDFLQCHRITAFMATAVSLICFWPDSSLVSKSNVLDSLKGMCLLQVIQFPDTSFSHSWVIVKSTWDEKHLYMSWDFPLRKESHSELEIWWKRSFFNSFRSYSVHVFEALMPCWHSFLG